MVTRAIESAQKKVEARNFDIRKNLLEYDDVTNDQRQEIYQLRNEILEAGDIAEMVGNLRRGVFTDMFRSYVPAESVEEQWDLPGLQAALAGGLAARACRCSRWLDEAGVAERRGPVASGCSKRGRRDLRREGGARRTRSLLRLRAQP